VGINSLLSIIGTPLKSVRPGAIAEAKTTAQTLIGKLRLELVGPGALSDREVQLLEDIIANPTKLLTLDSSNKVKLETLKKRLDTSLRESLRSEGLTEPREQMGITPRN